MQEEDDRVFPVGVIVVGLDDQAPQAWGVKLLCFHDSSEFCQLGSGFPPSRE